MSERNTGFRIAGAVLAASLALAGGARAEEPPCGICARTVVIDSDLAQCFLERYPQLVSRAGGAVAVNLEDCETSRGVVAALRPPRVGGDEPTLRFIVSTTQLACIKAKLEEPDVVLDPSLTIDLDAC